MASCSEGLCIGSFLQLYEVCSQMDGRCCILETMRLWAPPLPFKTL
jgi:hypothetical protein